MKMINIENLTKSFNNKTVLNNINLSVNKGEIIGLLGPSGAGKTTLIKILTGQLAQNSGISQIFNENCNTLSQNVYSKIGMVLDNSGLYDRLNGYDNLLMYARIYNIDKSNIEKSLLRVGLTKNNKTAVGKYSKGMRSRLILARAIMHKPELLFLDEPTSGLDPTTSQHIHELIFELKNEGATIFLTTHDMVEATKLCDNVALLNEGIIVEYGNPEDICRKHNLDNSITILLKDNTQVTIMNNKNSANQISEYFAKEMVVSIHSSEPNLETVFIALTNRGLV